MQLSATWEARLPFKAAWDKAPDAGAQEDLRLMDLVKDGDAEAFNSLMRKYEKTVLNLIYRFTGDREGAHDLAQEVFLRIYRAAGRFEAKAKFFTYLYKVTLNLCRNARDKTRRRGINVSLDATPEDGPRHDLPDPAGSSVDHVQRGELADAIKQAVMSLPEDQREVVILQRYKGLAYEEIAETLGLTVPAVKSRLHRAKLGLQKRLAAYLEDV